MATNSPTSAEVEGGQAVYTPLLLRFYDLFVLRFSNRFAWRCPRSRMLAHYDAHVSVRHLDVGVGTGWFLDQCRFPAEPQITLLDLNDNSLRATARRIQRYNPRTLKGNVLEPVDLGGARFDSVAMNFLLHCVPGPIEEKAATAIGNLRTHLDPGGVIFGSTILGRGVDHNAIGRTLQRVYNKKGIFSNLEDDAAGLQRALARAAADVEVNVVGVVALFSARG